MVDFTIFDQIKFVLQSRGSLQELIDDLNVCEDEQYLSAGEIALLKQSGWRVHQLIDGYVRYLRDQKAGSRPRTFGGCMAVSGIGRSSTNFIDSTTSTNENSRFQNLARRRERRRISRLHC